MGSEFLTEKFDGNLDSTELKNKVVDMISNYVVEPDDYYDDEDEDEYYERNYGGYSGTWREVKHECSIGSHDVFESYDKASDWLADNCQKWEGALAVKYYTGMCAIGIHDCMGLGLIGIGAKDVAAKAQRMNYKVGFRDSDHARTLRHN
jgi:hypothetical protein